MKTHATPVAHMSEDSTSVQLEFKTKYTAIELEQLIYELAEVRGAMEPPVPNRQPESDDGDESVSGYSGFEIAAGRFDEEEISLLIRHPGMGWMAFGMSNADALALAKYLCDETDGTVGPSLFDERPCGQEPH